MSITAIFANSPFDKELRIDCVMLKMITKKDGMICILQDFYDSIFEIENTDIDIKTDEKELKIRVIGTGIVKFEKNVFSCFGNFKEIER